MQAEGKGNGYQHSHTHTFLLAHKTSSNNLLAARSLLELKGFNRLVESFSEQSQDIIQGLSRPPGSGVEDEPGAPAPTQDVDKELVQLVGEERLWKAVEMVRHRFENVPLKSWIRRLLAVVLRP